MSFTVASSAVHEGKSTTAKIARISEPVVVQYVTADGKASKVADPAKAVVTYSTASGEPVVVRDVNSDSTAVTITSVAAGEVKRPAIVYQVKPVESHGTITYTTTTSSQDKVGKVLIAHSSTVSEVKPDQVVLARPVPEGDSKHVFVQLKDSEPKTGLVFVKAKGGAERGIEVFANPNMVDSTGNTSLVVQLSPDFSQSYLRLIPDDVHDLHLGLREAWHVLWFAHSYTYTCRRILRQQV